MNEFQFALLHVLHVWMRFFIFTCLILYVRVWFCVRMHGCYACTSTICVLFYHPRPHSFHHCNTLPKYNATWIWCTDAPQCTTRYSRQFRPKATRPQEGTSLRCSSMAVRPSRDFGPAIAHRSTSVIQVSYACFGTTRMKPLIGRVLLTFYYYFFQLYFGHIFDSFLWLL